MTKASLAAYKAHATRRARDAFATKYPGTWDIAEMILQGYETPDIADALLVTRETVAAVRANLNRPCQFSDMADACNY